MVLLVSGPPSPHPFVVTPNSFWVLSRISKSWCNLESVCSAHLLLTFHRWSWAFYNPLLFSHWILCRSLLINHEFVHRLSWDIHTSESSHNWVNASLLRTQDSGCCNLVRMSISCTTGSSSSVYSVPRPASIRLSLWKSARIISVVLSLNDDDQEL